MVFVPSDPHKSGGSASQKIRTMIVDDSLVIRGILRKLLLSDNDIEVVAAVGNGKLAIEALDKQEIDAVILDIEMPIMDGLTALPLLLEKKPDLVVLVASTLTLKNADISLKCLELGAKDYISKPTTQSLAADENAFKAELINKLKIITASLRENRRAISSSRPGAGRRPLQTTKEITQKAAPQEEHYSLRPLPMLRPNALVIGCSTGGPQALIEIFKGAKGKFNVPIFITQHMPPLFTKSLATHVERISGIPAKEAEEGDIPQPGKIYVAPGNFHMEIHVQGKQKVIHLTQDPPENFCRPSVNPLLRTCIKAYEGRALCAILTGLGQDGSQGAQEFVKHGGTIIAQDRQSSVVWGMPGAVTKAGLVSAVLPLKQIQGMLDQMLNAFNPSLGVKL
jgi:Chemotaxis response regulator containing a CheY-like receiver domain and a methylesterase domain